jgi:hypothetical protein
MGEHLHRELAELPQGHRLDGLRPRGWRKSEILTKEGTHMLQRLRSRLHSEEKGFTLIELLSSS